MTKNIFQRSNFYNIRKKISSLFHSLHNVEALKKKTDSVLSKKKFRALKWDQTDLLYNFLQQSYNSLNYNKCNKFSSLLVQLCFLCFYAMLVAKVLIVTQCNLSFVSTTWAKLPLHATTICCYYLEKCYSRVCNVITLTQLRPHRYDLLLVLGKMDYLSTDSINAIPIYYENDRTVYRLFPRLALNIERAKIAQISSTWKTR